MQLFDFTKKRFTKESWQKFWEGTPYEKKLREDDEFCDICRRLTSECTDCENCMACNTAPHEEWSEEDERDFENQKD